MGNPFSILNRRKKPTLKLRSIADGDESKASLIFISGFANTSAIFDPLCEKLSGTKHPMFSLDLPGYGVNKARVWTTTQDVLVELVEAIPMNSILVGWSLGGMLATKMAYLFPDRITSFVTIASNPSFVARKTWPFAMPQDSFNSFVEKYNSDRTALLKSFMALQSIGDENPRSLTRTLKAYQLKYEVDLLSESKSLSCLSEIDNIPILKKLKQPSLHIFAEGDALVPVEAAIELQKHKPSIHLESAILNRCSHLAPLTHAEPIQHLVSTFLDQQIRAQEKVNRRETRRHRKKKQVEQIRNGENYKQKLVKNFNSAAGHYDQYARLQKQVATRLVNNLVGDDTLVPGGRNYWSSERTVLDVGCGTGFCLQSLGRHIEETSKSKGSEHQLHGLDLSPAMLNSLRAKNIEGQFLCCADMENLPFLHNSFDGIVSSLSLQWSEDLNAIIEDFYRLLKPGGWCAFSTMGRETLADLKSVWAQVDQRDHINQFASFADIKDDIIKSGFDVQGEIQEMCILPYANIIDVMRELKGIGANTVRANSANGLMGKNKLKMLQERAEVLRDSRGRISVGYEVYYYFLKKPRMSAAFKKSVSQKINF